MIAVASYNIHRCRGLDGVVSPARIAAVLHELDADVIALQEVDSANDFCQLEFLARATGYRGEHGPTLTRRRRRYGNAVLTRLPLLAVRRLDLSVAGREPRGALDVEVALGGGRLRVLATHLGLRRRERQRQAESLGDAVAASELPTVLLGDLNEWLPGDASLQQLTAKLWALETGRTFPARLPLLPLDRILVSHRAAALQARVHRSPLARLASDHLPVTARLEIAALLRAAA